MIQQRGHYLKASTSIQDVANQVTSMTEKVIGELSSYEKNIIKTLVTSYYAELPSTKLLITTRLGSLNRVKADLSYILLRIKDIRKSYSIPYTTTYNKLYTLGTKKGLPSKLAIEADMFSRNPELADAKDKLDSIDMLIEYYTTQLELVNSLEHTLESRKYDV